MDLKEQAASSDRARQHPSEGKDELLINIVNHLRHDWMNDIQVLYGYLRLNKHDKLIGFMETIKQKAARESLISKLGVTDLTLYLYTYRVRYPMIQLEVDVEPDVQWSELPVDLEGIAQMAIALLDAFSTHTYETLYGDPHRLQLEWMLEEEQLVLNFDFRGDMDQAGLKIILSQTIASAGKGMRIQSDSEFDTQWAALTLRIPLDHR